MCAMVIYCICLFPFCCNLEAKSVMLMTLTLISMSNGRECTI